MINQVALVSQTERVTTAQLSVASAAIQRQVTRDASPIWDLNATVDAFDSINDVPIGYWQVVIKDTIPVNAQGVHENDANGQPFALVEFSENWILTTSHECLEMLVDPSGNRIVTGNSVAPNQGRVQYLVEVCDPSEAAAFGYTVNGVLVSDFYTPNFFDPVVAPGVRYSFTGAITGPRQVLDGGYLSWFDPQSNHVFQLFVENGQNRFEDLGEFPKGFGSLRMFADRNSSKERKAAEKTAKPKGLLLTGAGPKGKQGSYDQAVRAQAKALQAQIDVLVR